MIRTLQDLKTDLRCALEEVMSARKSYRVNEVHTHCDAAADYIARAIDTLTGLLDAAARTPSDPEGA